MLKLLSFLIPFIKESVFGQKIDIQKEQSIRKKATFFLIVFLLGYSYLAADRLLSVSARQLELEKELAHQKASYSELVAESAKLKAEKTAPKPCVSNKRQAR